jgi:hypothetical protein
MQFSKSQKILIGFLTLWPPVYVAVFVMVWFGTFVGMTLAALGIPTPGLFGFCFIIPLHLATMLLIVAMTVFWGIEVYRDPVLVGDKKVLWMLVVILGGSIGQAVHFFMNVWPEDAARVLPSAS